MKRAGYEVKTVRGGGISFRLTGQGQERFTRLRASTLGDGYDLQDVLSAIEGKEKRPGRSERKISLAVDIQAKLAAGKGPGYERWAKVFNIKQMAAALAYIQDNNLTDYEQLAQKATEAADRFHVISEQVKQTEQAMKTNAGLKAATVQYAKTRPVFEQYKATKYSRKFRNFWGSSFALRRLSDRLCLENGLSIVENPKPRSKGKYRNYGEWQKDRKGPFSYQDRLCLAIDTALAATLAYIQDNNLTDYEQLAQKATEAADRFHAISEQIKQTEQAMKTNAGLKAATVQYAKTRPVFEQYKATKYSRKFLAEHEADLELYRAAQAEMRSLLGGAKLPKMDVLKEEGRKLTAKKKQLYGEYQKARRDMQEIVTIKANIDTLMGYTEPGRKQEKER